MCRVVEKRRTATHRSITLLLAAAAALSACGGTPAPTLSVPREFHMLRLLDARGGVTFLHVSAPPKGSITADQAKAVAAAQSSGVRPLAAVAADVRNNATGRQAVCWVVSVQPTDAPAGDGRSPAPPDNYDVYVIDAATGFVYDNFRGYDPTATS